MVKNWNRERLQKSIIDDFRSRFAPGARLLYVGASETGSPILDNAGFEQLGLAVPNLNQLPDVVLFDPTRNWLFLIQTIISGGSAASPNRRIELEKLFEECSAGLVFLSAFPNFDYFKGIAKEAVWGTSVWLAEIPDHLIHFNGERFLGPHS